MITSGAVRCTVDILDNQVPGGGFTLNGPNQIFTSNVTFAARASGPLCPLPRSGTAKFMADYKLSSKNPIVIE